MLKPNYIPNWLTLFLSIGIVLGYNFKFQPIYLIITLTILIVLLIISSYIANKKLEAPIHFTIITFIIFVFIGIETITFHSNLNKKNDYSKFLKVENLVLLQIDKVLKPSQFYQRYWAKIVQINNIDTNGKILVNIKKDSLEEKLKIDDIVYTKSKLVKINPPLNPYEFNYKDYLQRQQIYHRTIINKNDFYLLSNSKTTLKGYAFKLRTKIKNSLGVYHFSKDQMAIINALLLGQRQDISNNLMEDYKKAGAMHILAISGLHIGIVLLILSFLLKPIELLKNGRIIKLIVLLFFLWSFAFLAGLSASIVRSVTMFTAIAIGFTIKKKAKGNNALVISMFFLLLVNPFYLFDVGFQLSYLAVFSILNLQPVFAQLFKPKQKIIRYLWQLFTVTIAAQIGVLPLSLYYFHQFPGLFFISSMVIIPFLGIILGLGFLVLFLALFHVLPMLLAEFYTIVIKGLNNFITFIAHQEKFIFYNIHISLALTITSYLLLFLSLVFFSNKTYKNLLFVLLSVISIQGVLLFEKFHIQTTNEFIVFHKLRNSLIINRKGDNLTVLQDSFKNKSKNFKSIENYKLNTGYFYKEEVKELKNSLSFANKNLLVIDSSSIYFKPNKKVDFLLLRNSPKINFERMVKNLQPNTVIADGSNYKSFINNWKKTCKENKIMFYNTFTQGAFILQY